MPNDLRRVVTEVDRVRYRRVAALVLTALLAKAAMAQNGLPPAIDGDEFAARRQHWAWQPLQRVEVDDPSRAIDALLAESQRRRGVVAAGSAAPHTLLRRLWLDLVGLPPSAETVRAFVAEPSEAAYRAQVDALLSSHAFAERQARHWLDLVRYAETLGHESDYVIPNAWRYRDYVIRAIDADVPFDAFVREHIAGDLLPEPRRNDEGDDESVQGTAFWWFAEQTHSPVDARQHESDRVDNQIDVLGKAVLGMTVACARCHDHKFDAIRAADYYALAGFVRSSRYVQQPTFAYAADGEEFGAAIAAQRRFHDTWLAVGGPALPPVNATTTLRDGDEVLASVERPADWLRDNDGFGAAPWDEPWLADPSATPYELRRLPGPWWHSGIAGTAREGVLGTPTFAIARPYLHVRVAGKGSRVQVVVDGLNLLRDPIYGGLHRSVDNPDPHWVTFDLRTWPGSTAYLQAIDQRAPELADSIRGAGNYADDAWIAVQTVILSEHRQPPEGGGGGTVAPMPWATPPDALLAAADDLHTTRNDLRVAPTLPGMGDGTGIDAHVFLRGKHDLLGPVVQRRFLEALDGDDAMPALAGSGRLALAEAVFAPDNPLPARVFVNRVWHHLFGAGLARTVDNLGVLGDPPSQPELLDWLAADFVAHGWSRKHVFRRIVLSDAYRRAAVGNAAAEELDPRNLLLHRQNVRRLEAEAVRDALLAVSGLLRDEPFGPSVPLPHEALDPARGMPPESGPLDGNGRRSIYLAVRRNFLSPMLQAFDLPTPFATVGARNVSNVPAQSLTLLNDPFVHHVCRAWAERLGDLRAEFDRALDAGYLAAFSRLPDADEREQCRTFLAAAATQHGVGLAEPAPWADLLHCLTVTKEFTYRR
ncbi:MAG: hypothetical protein RL398_1394 [Planctomycetota bacterium]|jgi:cytochrome c553